MENAPGEITRILIEAENGSAAAEEHLWKAVYAELRRMAHRELHGERAGRTFSTTALVHEAYLKMIGSSHISCRNRQHFFALACRAMRCILVDHARYRSAEKRRAQQEAMPLESSLVMAETRSEELLALEEALQQLSAMDERLGQVVECRFFGGLSNEETAEVLGVSSRTVERDWQRARAHLYRALRMDERP